MRSIPWLADLQYLPPVELFLLVLMVIVACMATGFASDAIMKKQGFGPVYNGILALIGVCAGIYLRYRWFSHYRADDVYTTIGFAMGSAIVLLLVLSFVKNRFF
jgi:uncharacterized membrane protein YeaQ/YmgE (transglycosylase-associated protein family)